MGAAVQGGLIAGIDVGPILVDITPHTLGISALGDLHGFLSEHSFSPIIERNTPLPASQTEIYSTVVDDQEAAQIRIFQGENQDTRYNTLVGEFEIEGLAEVPAGNQILVRLDLDLNGILKVTATERATGLAKHVVIDNATERFRQSQRSDAVDRLEAVFEHARSSMTSAALATPDGLDQDHELSRATTEDAATPAYARRSNPPRPCFAKAKGLVAGCQCRRRRRAARDARRPARRPWTAGRKTTSALSAAKSRNSFSTSKTRDAEDSQLSVQSSN